MPLIVVCRFIPGGRTAVMLSCGIVRYDRRRFIIATAIAGVIWACYAFFIGRLGGKAFEDKPWAGLLLAFGGTLAISGLIELVRRLRARRAQRRAGAQGQGDAERQATRKARPTRKASEAQGQADAARARRHADAQATRRQGRPQAAQQRRPAGPGRPQSAARRSAADGCPENPGQVALALGMVEAHRPLGAGQAQETRSSGGCRVTCAPSEHGEGFLRPGVTAAQASRARPRFAAGTAM